MRAGGYSCPKQTDHLVQRSSDRPHFVPSLPAVYWELGGCKNVDCLVVFKDGVEKHLMCSYRSGCRMALEAMQVLLVRAQLDEVLKTLDLEEGWAKMKEPQQSTDGVALLAK